MLRLKRVLASAILLCCVFAGFPAWGQADTSDSTPLVRIERQIRVEDTCMLVRNNGQYHLERVVLGLGQTRIFEGTLPAESFSQLQQMLNTDEVKQLSQSQIKMELVGEDLDHLLLAVNRPTGWQSLNFPTGKSRKPYKNSLDPLVKWLDRNMQQQNPLPPQAPGRCMPTSPNSNSTQSTAEAKAPGLEAPTTDSTTQAAKNPYLLRIIEDHIMADTSSTTSGAWQQNIGQKMERTCMIVYQSGRYRMEKSKQELNAPLRTEVFHDALSEGQIKELRQILDAPDLANLQHQTTSVGLTVKEGETVNLVVPRGASTQKLSFASYFGVRTQEVGLKDNLHTGVDAELPIIKPLRNWLKTNVESRKAGMEKNSPSTTCIPSIQPE